MRLAYAVLGLLLLGCDPTAGLSDSADAALPELKRYFDGRGSKLAEGPWNRVVVDLDAETLYHVGARRADDEEPTFHLFGADAREGCEVSPNAGTWLMGKARGAPFRVLPFLESIDDRGRGRLRFTQLDCTVQDLAIEDAGRPYTRLYDDGFLVPTKNGYTFADPWRGESRELAANLEQVLLWDSAVLFWADGVLKSFTSELEPGSSWGNSVLTVIPVGDVEYLVEDTEGVHRVTFDRDSLEMTAEPALTDACHLQRFASTAADTLARWLVAEWPCGSNAPSLLEVDEDLQVQSTVVLPFEADSRHARTLTVSPRNGAEPPLIGVVYLTEVDDEGLGTVWIWRGDDSAPLRLGERGTLDSVHLEAAGSEWDGTAQTNAQTLGGLPARDWVRFRWDGTSELIAERVVQSSVSGELLVNFDGVAGDLPLFSDDGYDVLAQGVPANATIATSYVGDKLYARVDRFDGAAGRLLLGGQSNQPGAWATLASSVPPAHARFAWFMPALVFLEDWDDERGAGRLVAYNYELDARSTISEGVSSFDLTSYPWDGVVYAVPAGKQQGLWFSKAK